MALPWKDLAYKIELASLCRKFFMRWTQGVFPMTNALAYFGENSEKKFWNFVCSPTHWGKKGCQQCWDSSLNRETKKIKFFRLIRLLWVGWVGIQKASHDHCQTFKLEKVWYPYNNVKTFVRGFWMPNQKYFCLSYYILCSEL